MNTQDIQALISFSEKLHYIARKESDLLKVEHFRMDNAIDSPRGLKQTFDELQNEDRLLNIGIVGQVKAGKSSLLNALFFDGESILPKAATPKTASLTTLTWGEQFQVDVEFFNRNDLEEFQRKAQEYADELEQIKAEELEKIQSKKRTSPADRKPASQKSSLSPQERAERQAKGTMRRQYPDLLAAADQISRIQESGICLEDPKEKDLIRATGPGELAEKLQDYVGAQGRYTPFVKAVHIAMPQGSLRDARVIDTPGTNDPVASREARTVELLKTCDVIFIVSPAGRFLDEQDLEVMGRITTKEGVQKIILVASRVDEQLSASEKRARPNDALKSIRTQLAQRAGQVLSNFKERLGIDNVFDAVIHNPEGHLLHSASICHGLRMRFEDQNSWDSDERGAWEALCEHYPDYFSDSNPEASKFSLAKLANTEELHQVLKEVRAQKDEIQSEKIKNLWEQKRRGLLDFQQKILNTAADLKQYIQDTDIEELEKQQQELEKQDINLSTKGDSIYEVCRIEYQGKLQDTLKEKQDELFKASQDKMHEAERTYIYTGRREKSGFFSGLARLLGTGGYENYTEPRMEIVTAQVNAALQKFLLDVETDLEQAVRESRADFNQRLAGKLVPELGRIIPEFDTDMLDEAMRNVVRSLPDPAFSLGISFPDELKSQGTLKHWQAEAYKDKALDFYYELQTRSREKIRNYMKEVDDKLPRKIFNRFSADLQEQIRELKTQVENKTQTMDRLDKIIDQTQGVTL